MKFIYCGFDLFYDCLEHLCNMGFECVGIFSCKVDEVYESSQKISDFAYKNNIPFTYKRITTEDINNLNYDFMVSAGYYYKIPITNKKYQVNIHPSLLPDGRGPWPMPYYFLKGYNECGVTAHILSDGMDEGDILHSKRVRIDISDNLETLTHKLVNAALEMLSELFGDFQSYYQNKQCQNEGVYWKEPTVNDMTFTLEDPYSKVEKITKAFYGFECYLKIDGKIIKINKAFCVKDLKQLPKDSVWYKINGGYLCVLKLA